MLAVGADLLQEANQAGDIRVEGETPGRERQVAGVDPVR